MNIINDVKKGYIIIEVEGTEEVFQKLLPITISDLVKMSDGKDLQTSFDELKDGYTKNIKVTENEIIIIRGDGKEESFPLKYTGDTYEEATTKAGGLMSAKDKLKLDGIDENANKYTHPVTPGNKHIPAGGTPGQVLVNIASGEAAWVDNENNVSDATHINSGLMSTQDKIKLDNINDNATSEILSDVEPDQDTGNFWLLNYESNVGSNYDKVKRFIDQGNNHKLLSHWTSSNTVEMDNGNSLETELAEVRTIKEYEVVIHAKNWVGESAPFTNQVISPVDLDQINCSVSLSSSATQLETATAIDANIGYTDIGYDALTRTLTFTAVGDKPMVDIPIVLCLAVSMNIVEVPYYIKSNDSDSSLTNLYNYEQYNQ